jgi:hypothetical protein
LTAIPRVATNKLGTLHDVRIRNVAGRAENSIRICGSDQSRIHNVLLENVSVKFDRWTSYPGGLFDNRPTKVMADLPRHDNPGIMISQTDGVRLRHCRVSWGRNLPDYFTHALETENVTGLQLTDFNGPAAHPDRDEAITFH